MKNKFFNNNINLYLAILFLLIFLSAVPSASASDKTALNRALEEKTRAYEQFIQALNDGRSDKEIEKLSEAYKRAEDKYNNLMPANVTDGRTSEAESAGQKTASDSNIQISSTGNGELKAIIESIHTYKIKSNPDYIIQKLENFINTAGNPEDAALAKIELANVYSKYKSDFQKAADILRTVISGSKSGKHYDAAEVALKRAEFQINAAKMAADIQKHRSEAKNFLNKYKQTPITKPLTKVKNLFSYYGSLFKYRKSIAGYRSYKSGFDKSENYYCYDFIADITGARPEFGVEDVFSNSNLSVRDVKAEVKHLADNVEAFYARWRMLNDAKHTIDMSYFIFDKDPIGNAILGILLKKTRAGVKVRLILDAHGCGDFAKKMKSQDYLQELAAEPNATVKIFNPVHKAIGMAVSDLRNLISSNHQKIIITDGETLITGGRNISAHYLADPRDYKEAYRDTDVMVRSAELSEQLKMTFEEEFDALENFEVKKDLLINLVKRDGELLDCVKSIDSWIRGNGVYHSKKIEELNEEIASFKHMTAYNEYVHFGGSYYAPVKLFGKNSIQQERNDITENIIAFINAASEEIIIQNPYVIFTDKAKAALKKAGERGVKIIINTNSPTCFPAANGDLMTLAFFLDEWMPFLKENPNAKIYGVAIARKLHAKVFIFDRAVTVIGTYNMDPMSENINAENVCAVNSKEFAEECRAKIFEDLQYSKEYKIGINEKGEAYEVFGPGSLGDEKTLNKLRLIKKLKFLRPLI
ncbi:MAG TPA: phosphatidylserine/phosphatidylglycerophosphate/cardiolipin synthase family protein [Candidatus Wallbacteria bacterium]|nr:phosphatidylserine/phosphatidylglycerophosphate/cardiolipin synthase family protein [Candidatus Wallbacteria bacterium]